uniref:Cadherin domain-containing protein n=1 Tax=Esox lucius TaxID=8010 RepID=A0A3P8YRA1_ESOLU
KDRRIYFYLLDSFVMFVFGLKLRRQKREWIIPPKKLSENRYYTDYIAKIRSDKQYNSTVIYSLTGNGADKDPVDLFRVNKDSGIVTIHGLLDREKKSHYNLFGVAKYADGSYAEKNIELKIIVEDMNDCPPVFAVGQIGSVMESSAAGTFVIKVNATDDDAPNTAFSQIRYSIEGISNSDGMFSINAQTGEILVQKITLDRETKDTYTLTIIGSDNNGKSGGNTGTGQVVIKILDINDNIPTLEKEYYEGEVEENTFKEVLRIQAIDLDQQFTDNWLAVFTIVSGNEAGYFNISTDSKTNEGIIWIQKPLDYEELTEISLVIRVSNKAEYYFGSSTSGSSGGDAAKNTYTAKIKVINQNEGPTFQPKVKVVTISEDSTTVTINKVITTYTAIDIDTRLTATNVRYAKLNDVDNWVSINEKTGNITLNKLPDRESIHLVNGTYNVVIIAVTNDLIAKTATGTIAIQVEDFNDHCPTLTATTTTMCLGKNAVYATAVDGDSFPNGAPFKFRVIQKDSNQKWTVENLNATTTILRDHAQLWPGYYKVDMEITDQQGKACAEVQTLNVAVCTCHEVNEVCLARQSDTNVTLGAPAILLLLLGLLLLLDHGDIGSSIKNTDFQAGAGVGSGTGLGMGSGAGMGLGMRSGAEIRLGMRSEAGMGLGMGSGAGMGLGMGSGAGQVQYKRQINQYHENQVDSALGRGTTTMDYHRNAFSRNEGYNDGMALSEGFLEQYYSAVSNDHQKDSLLIYDYEGHGSPVGSVGCCSLLGGDDDLEFLNDLGPKFKTLAKICQGSMATEVETVHNSVHSSSSRPTTSTHKDFSRDVSLTGNTLITSASASNSSTQIQESLVRPVGSATISKVHVQENVGIPGQTLLIQQPNMYYTAAPMYVVENQPRLVLVDQRGGGGYVNAQAALGQMGLGMGQGMVHAGDLSGSQGMLLVERQVGVGGRGGSHGHIVMGGGQIPQGGGQTITRESNVEMRQTTTQGGHVLQGARVEAGGGFLRGSLSGSRNVLVVENRSGTAPAAQGSTGLGETQFTLHRGQGSSSTSSSVHGLEVTGEGVKV